MFRIPSLQTVSMETIIPDGCNLGVVFRTLFLINGIVFVAAFFQVSEIGLAWSNFIESTMLVEPVCLVSTCLFCVARRVKMIRLAPEFMQRIMCVTIPIFIMSWAICFYAQFEWYVIVFKNLTLWKGVFIAGLLGAGIQYYFELKMRASSPALLEARLQALQARIRPHFLFNSLNAVLSLIRVDPRMAETTLENLADLFRVSMRDNRIMTTLDKEIQLCEQYLAIEKIRLGERLQVHWDTTDINDTVLHSVKIPALLLQPLLENAVHYGVEPVMEIHSIHIRIAYFIGKIEIKISNFYDKNISFEMKGNHMALVNIRERLSLLYDLEAQLNYGVKDDLFEVQISFPYLT